jgi:ABC-type antimicrobial peptide transport system permease subunit
VPVARLPFPIDRAHLAVRMRPGSSAGVGRDLRQAVWSAAPDVPVPVVRAMDEWLTLETSGRRFDSAVFATFGALALLLAAGGLYGTMLHLAGQRTRELGIRMALGASRARIERELVTGGVGMAVLGVGVGLGGAWALGRFLESRLWGVGAGDPSTLALAALLLLATAALASWIPARRAGRTDPVKTLRVE